MTKTALGVIAGTLFTVFFSCVGLLGWLSAASVCTGTGSWPYTFSRLCHSEAYAALFLVGNVLLLSSLYYLLAVRRVRPAIRNILLAAFVAYGLFVILAPTAIWDLPYFTTITIPSGATP